VAERDRIVYGLHSVEAVIESRIGSVRSAVVLDARPRGSLAAIVATLESAGIPVERAGRDVLDQLAHGGTHQGIVLKVPPPREQDLNTLEELVLTRGTALRLLVLDQVEDPRNLGACLRTADAAGVDAIVVPKARSAKLSAAALKAAAGAAETVPLIVVPNLARSLRWLADAGVRLVGTDERGEVELFDAEIVPPIAIVLGAEGSGLRRLSREACDQLIRIPMVGSVESLNVSVAAAVVLYEMLRQTRSLIALDTALG
jgi:23S rRNA (guanosine2251-2'-O)-methyltransferase